MEIRIMGKVFFSITASLDGFMAPEWRTDEQWLDQWMQFLNAGLVDEFHIAVAPVLLHSGPRVFDRLDPGRIELELAETIPSPRVTHLKYRVVRK
jgi:hypothetical protein